jgi:hypothetical protein
MRHLAQPRVLLLASAASLVTTLACQLRLAHWANRSDPLWLLESAVFLCGIVLWGFVFAWHTPYTGRPVLAVKIEPRFFIAATLAGIMAAALFHYFLDPVLRPKIPEEYPADLNQWMALTLFSLAFNQLFLVFAPFAWLVRLFRRPRVAAGLTVLFGAFVLAMKLRAVSAPISPALTAALLAGRLAAGGLAVFIYWRGGLLLIWWWTLLIEARHLPDCLDSH